MEDFSRHDERAMLVRYCARFTRDWSLAEDLTQQALLEAWQKSDHLYDQQVRSSWLLGIARNVCLRWVRHQRHETAHTASISDEIQATFEDEINLEEDVERHELAQLLEKALALLPLRTRTVLTQYYLEAVPQAALAARLGITVGAVEARLSRGKRALRTVLAHDLRDEAASYGLIAAGTTDWQRTHIWCPTCGQQRLLVRLPKPPGTISFRCPACSNDPDEAGWEYQLSNARFVQHLAGLTQPKAILRRFTAWAHSYYYPAATNDGLIACAQCGQQRRLQILLPPDLSGVAHNQEDRYGLSGFCPFCDWQDYCSPTGLLQSLPVVQHFWQEHPRMRLVFREPLAEAAGQRAQVVRFESLADAAHLDVVFAQDTLKLLGVYSNVS